MSTAIAVPAVAPLDPRVVQEVLLGGDLSKLTPDQRISYYNRVCDSLGLNPLTQPFAYLRLSGKEVLYAKKDCTEQLRFIHNISINPAGFTREVIEGVYVVTAPASMPSGRTDVSTGAVPIDGLKGENRANAMMKAETKAKRRVTLSICGLGMLDETEVESIPQAAIIQNVEKPRIALPAGTVQVLRVAAVAVHGGPELAEVTYVDEHGEEHTHRTSVDATGASVKLFTQLAEEAAPVVLTTKVTPRSKKTVIDQVRRWGTEAPLPSLTEANTALDAEIAAKEQDSIPF